MTIPVLFNFIKTAIIILSVTAFTLAFFYMYSTEIKKGQKEQ
jgi:hypothetical protein